MRALALTFAFALALTLGCSAKNPNFCEGADCTAIDAPIDGPPVACDTDGPDPTCPAGNPICVDGECTGLCESDADCATRPAGERICLVSTGACVECDENNEQADPPVGNEDECPAPAMAVCDGGSHACRPCEAHDECTSGICDAGRCAPEAEIVFMATTGADGGNCGTRAEPCLTLNNAVDKVQAAPALKYIFMAQSGTPYAARNNTDKADFVDVDVTVIGYGASVNRNGPGQIIEVHGASNVQIEGLEVSNATGPGIGAGIVVADNSSLTLLEVKVQNNVYRGVSASGTPTLQIRRSRFINNEGGGIFLDGGKVTLVNNVIAGNGDLLNSAFGGLSLNLTQNPNVIEFNTIVANSAVAGTADGMICVNGGVVARNNIIAGAATSPRVSGSCMYRFTLFTPDVAPVPPTGEGNMGVPTQAMYMFTPDFHIGAGSVAIGKAQGTELAGESLFDIDGDPRALGSTTLDVGVDEIP